MPIEANDSRRKLIQENRLLSFIRRGVKAIEADCGGLIGWRTRTRSREAA